MSIVHSTIYRGPIKCVYCNFACSDENQLQQHCKETHKYICDVCNKAFSSLSGISNHNKVAHGSVESLFTCKLCGKIFGSACHLKTHERSHSNNRNYQCPACKKTYKYKCTLDHHICELLE